VAAEGRDRSERITQVAAEGIKAEFPPRGAERVKERTATRRRSLLAALIGVIAAAVAVPVFALGGGSSGPMALAGVNAVIRWASSTPRRPGGTLAITTWGPGWCEPATTVFWDCVRTADPSLHRAFNPWDEITTPDALRSLFTRGGIDGARVEPVAGEQNLDRPKDSGTSCSGRAIAEPSTRCVTSSATPCATVSSRPSARTRSEPHGRTSSSARDEAAGTVGKELGPVAATRAPAPAAA
jgi:hypothetical protein